MATHSNSVLIWVRHAPFSTTLSKTAIDTTLAAASFDTPLLLLFSGAGVCHLLPRQDGRLIGSKHLLGMIQSLPFYDVEKFYVDADSLKEYGIASSDLPESAVLVQQAERNQLIQQAQHCIGF